MSGESAIRIAPAPYLRRLFALLVDILVIAIPFQGVHITEWGIPLPGRPIFPGWIGLTISILLIVLYWIAMEWALEGTLGKFVFALRVISEDGKPCTLSQSAQRNVLRFAVDILLASLVGLIAMLYDEKKLRRRIGDRVAGTVVVTASEASRIRTLLARADARQTEEQVSSGDEAKD